MNDTEFVRIKKLLMKEVAVLAKEEKRSKTNMVNVLLTEAVERRQSNERL